MDRRLVVPVAGPVSVFRLPFGTSHRYGSRSYASQRSWSLIDRKEPSLSPLIRQTTK